MALVEHLLKQDAPKAAARLVLRAAGVGEESFADGTFSPPADLLSGLPEAMREVLQTTLAEEVSRRAAQGAAQLHKHDGVAAEESKGGRNAPKKEELLVVDLDHVRLVDDADSASDCARELHALVHAEQAAVALDAEWRPDVGQSDHPPSLLQVAVWPGAMNGTPQGKPAVWLLDLVAVPSSSASSLEVSRILDEALAPVLASHKIRILGFSLQRDVDKLALLRATLPCFQRFCSVVDLHDACASAGGERATSSKGLAAQLRVWTGLTLDKSMQCSDWTVRPLSRAQVRYAAADVACLFLLYAAILRMSPSAIKEREMTPRSRSSSCGTSQESAVLPAGLTRTPACHADDIQAAALELTRDAVQMVSTFRTSDSDLGASCCRLINDTVGNGEEDVGRVEVNSLCFVLAPPRKQQGKQKSQPEKERQPQAAPDSEGELLLVLGPASSNVDIKWLSNWLGVSRKRLRMASAEECWECFGAVPGNVPPLPLKQGIRVLAFPELRAADVAGGLLAAAGCSGWKMLLDRPAQTLPLLTQASGECLASKCKSDGGKEVRFEWLPDPSCCPSSLDEVVLECADRGARLLELKAARRAARACEAAGASAEPAEWDEQEDGPFALRAVVEAPLCPLARKLRMVGVDCQIAGEFIRTDEPGIQGLLRVKVDTDRQDAEVRRAAADGRLIIVPATKPIDAPPGVHYRLRASEADQQFAELLEVFGLEELVKLGESRCGICNARHWQTLTKEEVVGQVPDQVLANENEFYRCGLCRQLFWAGEKYANTMDSLKAVMSECSAGSSVRRPPSIATS